MEEKPNGGYDELYKEISLSPNSFCDINRFDIPKLPIGTLEILMVFFFNIQNLSEELVKVDNNGKNVLDRIRKTYYEFAQEGSRNKLLVANGNILDYLKSFKWNDANFSKTDKLTELSRKIVEVF